MAKKPELHNVATGYTSQAALNDNFVRIQDSFDNTLSRDGSGPNEMQADLDMNSNDILNTNKVYANDVLIDGVSIADMPGIADGMFKQIQEWYEEFQKGSIIKQQSIIGYGGQTLLDTDADGNPVVVGGVGSLVHLHGLGLLVEGVDYTISNGTIVLTEPLNYGDLVTISTFPRISNSEAQLIVSEVLQRADEVQEYRDETEGFMLAAESAMDDAISAAEDAQDSLDAFQAITATATTLDPGSSATASFDPDTGILSLGIPRGDDGEMAPLVYDPQGIEADAFALANMTGSLPVAQVSGLGTAATADVTTSTTDTTAGRIMKVGDFGIGGTGPTTPDLDTLTTNGIWRVSSGVTANAPSSGAWSVFHMEWNPGVTATQLAFPIGQPANSNRIYVRVRLSGVWQPWVKQFGTSNILGTVSQSSGVPTGAVIERGSNANGEYVRFADGTQICTVSGREATFSSALLLYHSWTYPAQFSQPPFSGVSIGSVSNFTGVHYRDLAYVRTIPTDTSVEVWIGRVAGSTRPFESSDKITGMILLAIGRWY